MRRCYAVFMNSVISLPLESYERTVPELMERLDVADLLAVQKLVLIKPNLVNGDPPPVTTDAAMVAAVAGWCRQVTRAKILVVEGSGEGDTLENYRRLGYGEVPADELLDLDREEITAYEHPRARRFPRAWLPEIMMKGFLISVPVLKDHSITGITLSLKNLVGILPTSRYRGTWSYKKSAVHDGNLDQAIADLALYRPPDLALIDGRIGMKGSHLSGTPCSPPKNVLLGGVNPWSVDAEGARVLGHSWDRVGHLRATQGLSPDSRAAG